MNNDLNKQATIAAIERINAVEGLIPPYSLWITVI